MRRRHYITCSFNYARLYNGSNIGAKLDADIKLGDSTVSLHGNMADMSNVKSFENQFSFGLQSEAGGGTFSIGGSMTGSGNYTATTGYSIPLTKGLNLTIGGEYIYGPSLAGAPGENAGKITISIGSGGNNSLPLPSFISNKLPEPTRIGN